MIKTIHVQFLKEKTVSMFKWQLKMYYFSATLCSEVCCSSNLWVLEPHLQPLHSHESSLFEATCGCEQAQQVSGHVVHWLPAV